MAPALKELAKTVTVTFSLPRISLLGLKSQFIYYNLEIWVETRMGWSLPMHAHFCRMYIKNERKVTDRSRSIAPLLQFNIPISWHSRRRACRGEAGHLFYCKAVCFLNLFVHTLIFPHLSAGPSSASRSTYRSILYSRPPRRLKPNPLAPLSSSTV